MRDITFDLHGSGWSPSVIDSLEDVLCEFPDDFSTSKTDFGSCSLMPFKITVPPDSEPVTSRPYRINPILAKKADAVPDQYLAAGLIQHSTSPYSSPMVAIPKKDGGVRITINYKKPNDISCLGQLPTPRVDEVLDYMGKKAHFLPLPLGLLVPPNHHRQGHHPFDGVLLAKPAIRVACDPAR